VLAAIARPERFERDVAASGSAVVGRAFFRDHHAWSAGELEAVVHAARSSGADAIVTTAKDVVRLERAPFTGLPVTVLHIEARIPDARFLDRLRSVIRRAA
jgi:tetraacyldisaccharide 4'-kinase